MSQTSNRVKVTKPKGSNKTLFIGIGVVIFVCLLCAVTVGGIIYIFTQPAVDVANDFMAALRDADYEAAYKMASPSLQDELGSAKRFSTEMREFNIEPVEWSFNSRSRENNTATLSGSVTFADGSKRDLTIILINDDGWQISGFRFDE